MSDWISVKNKLPPVGQQVLIFDSDGAAVAMYNGKYWATDGFICSVVTHWMPLPPPPTK